MMKYCSDCLDLLPNNRNYFDKKRGKCHLCRATYFKNYYKENKETIVRKRKKHYENNKEYFANKNGKYYQENKEFLIERCKANSKIYYENNKETIKIKSNHQQKQAYKKDPVKFAVRNAKRISKVKNLIYDFTLNDWNNCLDFFEHSCAYCGEKEKLEKDHVIPIAKGGHYTPNNIIPACKSCNASKRNKNMDDWYASHEKYSQENFIKIKEFLNKGDEIGRII